MDINATPLTSFLTGDQFKIAQINSYKLKRLNMFRMQICWIFKEALIMICKTIARYSLLKTMKKL